MIACSDCAQVFRAKRFSVVPKHAVICVPDSTSLNPNEKLTAFVELELAISRSHFIKSNVDFATASGWLQRLVRPCLIS